MEQDYKQIQDIETIKKEIICMIEGLYECKFIGKINVEPMQVGYTIHIDLFHNDKPITISAELNREKFLKFIYEELRTRTLDRVNLFGLHKYYE